MKYENKKQGRRIEVIFDANIPIAERERRLKLIDEILSRPPRNIGLQEDEGDQSKS